MNKLRCIRIVHERAMSACADDWLPGGAQAPCELCGKYLPLEMHHRQFRSRRGEWLPSNILAICSADHLAATQERAAPGVNVHSWEKPTHVPVKLWYTDIPVCLDDQGGYDPCCPVDNG